MSRDGAVTRPRKGTKATQGINQDIAVHSRAEAAAVAVAVNPATRVTACVYPHHRPSDWRLADGGPIVCGVCHPPVLPERLIKRRPARGAA